MRRGFERTWRFEKNQWYHPTFGLVSKRSDGWYGFARGNRRVGPFPSAKDARNELGHLAMQRRDPSRSYTTTIEGLIVTFTWSPKMRVYRAGKHVQTGGWSGKIHAKSGSGWIPGGSGSTPHEAEANTRKLLRGARPANDSGSRGKISRDGARPSRDASKKYASLVHSILRERYRFSKAEADGALSRWSSLVHTSWAAARNPSIVAREIKRYEEGEA